MAMFLLASVLVMAELQSNAAAAVNANGNTLEMTDMESRNYVINYIYEIELEHKDSPKLELDKDVVLQGESFVANGTNFDANVTADLSIFHEQLLSLRENGETAKRSAAVLLTKSDLTLSEQGGSILIENSEDAAMADENDDGIVMLVTNISPSDAPSSEYDVSLECEEGPEEDAVSIDFDNTLTVDNSTSKQFFELSLQAGKYEQCQIVMSPVDKADPAIESSITGFEVMDENDPEISVASVNATTDGEGSFMQDIMVVSDAETGRYVMMAETTDEDDNTTKRAIAPLTIIDDITSTAGANDDSSDGNSGASAISDVTLPSDSTGNNNADDRNGTTTSDNETQGPPDDGSRNDGGQDYVDFCQEVVSDSGNVNNTIVESSSLSASNTVSDDDVINVVQKIHGTYNGTGHLNTSISIDDSDTVSQSVNQNAMQNAVIKKCPGEPNDGGNQTNTIDMNATQLASNAYSDNTTIIIVQTIIIPKDCNTNVNAPIAISDRDTVTQSIDQDISQDGTIAYSGSGAGSNTVVQTSMQVAYNNATNDEVIRINQVIIVPPDCPVEIQAPVVVEGDDNVQMSIVQTAEQDVVMDSGASGMTIASSVSGSNQVTNTVITTSSQDGQNLFSDNDSITIEQNVYYVNDTSGWIEENFEENLADEFGNSTSSNLSNSTVPATNSTVFTEEGGGNSTEDVEKNFASPIGDQNYNNSTVMVTASSTLQDETNGDSSDNTSSVEDEEFIEHAEDSQIEQTEDDASDNDLDDSSSNFTDNSISSGIEEIPVADATNEEDDGEDISDESDMATEEPENSTADQAQDIQELANSTTPEDSTDNNDPPVTENTDTAETVDNIKSTANEDVPPTDSREVNDADAPAGNSTSVV
ncbi:MAG: hypothetical protein AB1351_03245 [Thermoproteota archaeon]